MLNHQWPCLTCERRKDKKRLFMQKHTCTNKCRTKLFYFHCFVFLVCDARFLLFLSVKQCMHFILPFLYFRKKMGLLSLCLRLTAIPTLILIILSVLLFSRPVRLFRKRVSTFPKVRSSFFRFLLETSLGDISVFTYLAGSILGGEQVEEVVGNHLHPFKELREWMSPNSVVCVCGCGCMCV